MTARQWPTVALVLLLAGSVPRSPCDAQSAGPLYPQTDAKQDIAAALRAVSRGGKRVLLDFGADWCPDCRVLGTLFDDPAVAPFVAANFDVVRVDVGRRDKNGDLVTTYGATSGDWIPAIVVLDAQGAPVGRTDNRVRLTRHTSADELLAVLRTWAPKRVVARLGSVARSGVRVDVSWLQDWSRESWLAATFTPDTADTHLYGKDLPAIGVNGLGRPTRLTIVSASGLQATGEVIADRPEREDRLEALHVTLPVYPPGPVTLLLPVRLTLPASADLSVSYMACGAEGCRAPVQDARIAVAFGSAPRHTR